MSANAISHEPHLDEAAAWRLIALLFEYPREGWRQVVADLGAEVQDPQLKAAAQAAQLEASEGVHQSLFGPGGPVPPREVTYLGGVQFGYLLAELTAWYEAFAYRPATSEAADHVSVEAGFVAFLALKEAYAALSGDDEHVRDAADAAARFKAEHLAMMAEPIADALEAGGPPYLALAARALRERVGPAPARSLPLAADTSSQPDDDTMVCATDGSSPRA